MDVFQPVRIGSLELRNRFVRSATWDASADHSGAVTDASVAIYRQLGQGGIGLIVSGYAFVSTLGQANYGQYGAHRSDMIPGLRRLVQAVHQSGSKIALQIVHAGSNSGYLASLGTKVLAVSATPALTRPHREMTEEDIEAIIADFEAAALRGCEAGFDAIQLHGAHGYLMSQFQSPISNLRQDKWGGSPENRHRFHLEVISRVRQAIGNFPLFIKFGAQDFKEGGLSLSEGTETARQMAVQGIEAIEVSSGIGLPSRVSREGKPEIAYFREKASAVKQAVKVPVIAVGGIRSLEMASNIIQCGDADMVAMCRPFIREPGLIARWQSGDTVPARCISCNRCLGVVGRREPLECGEERRLREGAKSSPDR